MANIKVRIGQSDAIKVLATSNSTTGIAQTSVNSTNVIGGIASVTSLDVSGSSTLDGNLNVGGNVIGDSATNISGINSVTATSFYGSASGLTGITADTIGTLVNLNVSGISTLGNLKISSGIITATSGVVTYYGDIAQIDGGSF
tara:strand:- start:4028 stop:4459 length:432 start_codon:yes stop_codon:yes gene_type:complete